MPERWWCRLTAAPAVAALVVTGCAGTPARPEQSKARSAIIDLGERRSIPALSGPAVSGRDLDISAYQGRVVVINVWASWCPPCRAEAPALVAVWRTFAPRGVEFVGLNVKDDPTAAGAYQTRYGIPYPSLQDPDARLLLRLRDLAPQVPPTTLVVDRAGRLAARLVGGVTRDTLDRVVAALEAESA